PEPFRGKRNMPHYTNYVANKVSEVLEIELQDIEELTTKNANSLFFNTHNTVA
ncbi:MAG TPA: hydrolase TatD, partial [Arcobacter sp.]|nr:hydrolase TatD [Arcobacter sp.]